MGKLLLPLILVGTGIGLVIVSVVFGFVVVPNIIDGKIKEEVRIVEGTETWDKWVEAPYPVYLRFFIFNFTNPTAIEDGEKPNLVEIGPYVYRERRVKVDIELDTDTETVAYRQPIDFFFEPELSKMKIGDEEIQLSPEDRFNVPNLPFLAISTSLYQRKIGPAAQLIVDYLVQSGESFVKQDVSVTEFIWDGFDINPMYGLILSALPEDERPPEFNEDKFAFYRYKNNSDDGAYVVRTGVSNSQNFGRIVTWENSSALNWWHAPPVRDEDPLSTPPENDKYCNMINGTDGSVFPPFLTEESLIRIFVTDICRSIVFEHKGEEEHLGVKGLKFGFPMSFYEDPHDNQDNYCFCSQPEGDINGVCTTGLIRIFPCKNGAPIVTSSPHFRHADPVFLDRITGLNPTDEHDTVAILEPNTGLLLKISKKVQISLEVQDFGDGFFQHFAGIQYTLLPVFWANEYVEMDQTNVDDLKGKLLTPMKAVTITKWVLIGVGALVACGGLGILVKRKM
jgi:lysosome membrane protein 2